MLRTRSPFISAFLVLVGTIIGAGVFGVPLVFSRLGIVTGSLLFWGVALMVLAAHLLFVDIISRDREQRRLPGYVGKALGRTMGRIAVVMHSLHLVGANLAYLILGGQFFSVIISLAFPDITILTWQILFWLFGAIVVLAGLRVVARVESAMTWALLAVMSIVTVAAFAQARGPFDLSLHGLDAGIGLGVFVFALSGITIIPEVYEVAGRHVRRTRLVIIVGTVLAAFMTWLFGISIYIAAHGRLLGTAADISAIFPTAIAWIVPVFGFLAVATSFIVTAFDLKSTYVYDLRLSERNAQLLTLGMPLVLLFVTTRDFFSTIDLVGAVFSATNAFLVAVTAGVVMRRATPTVPGWWRVLVPAATALLFLFVVIQRLAPIALH